MKDFSSLLCCVPIPLSAGFSLSKAARLNTVIGLLVLCVHCQLGNQRDAGFLEEKRRGWVEVLFPGLYSSFLLSVLQPAVLVVLYSLLSLLTCLLGMPHSQGAWEADVIHEESGKERNDTWHPSIHFTSGSLEKGEERFGIAVPRVYGSFSVPYILGPWRKC